MLPPVQSILEAVNPEHLQGRIFQTVAPEDASKDAQGNQLDYIVWTLISQNPNNTLADMPEDDAQRVQIDYYSASQTRVRQHMTSVRDAFEAVAYVVDGPVPDYEPDTRLHRQRIDVAFITNRDYENFD